MKKLTVSLDDETYRVGRVRAAEAGLSLSAMVREFLCALVSKESEFERLHREELELRKELEKLPPFNGSDRLSREDLHDRALERAAHEEALRGEH